MTFIIILAVGIFVFYLFNNDRKDVKINVLQRGGMKNIYKNFVNYIDLANSGHFAHEFSSEKTKFELAKDNGELLEYRFPIYSFNGSLVGHYYIGLQHTFGTFAHCYCINTRGKKIEGYIRELHNGRNTSASRDRSIEDYISIFSSLIMQMESIPNFQDKFYDYV